jgi:hypothetical protein
LNAALRFERLPHLAGLSPQQIAKQKESICRKHALAVIALENNYASWADLKRQLEQREKRDAIKSNNRYSPLYPRRCGGFINAWYANYEAARDHLAKSEGYLLPYKGHFFICQRGYIEALGLDPDDRDWELIGRDWVKPADRGAWERLNARLQSIEPNYAE